MNVTQNIIYHRSMHNNELTNSVTDHETQNELRNYENYKTGKTIEN